MPTFSEKPKINYEPAPQGTFLARCFSFIQLGTSEEIVLGKPQMLNKIRLSFELPTKTRVFNEEKGPQPIVVHQEYTLSTGSKSNLRKVIEGMIGTSLKDEEAYSFDVESLVGMPCVLNIKHKTSAKGTIWPTISSIAPLMEGQVCPAQINPSVILSFASWNQDVFDKLPQFIKDKIIKSEQYQGKFYKSSLTPEEQAKIDAMHVKAEEALQKMGQDEISPDDISFE